jgi:hypothetical protein
MDEVDVLAIARELGLNAHREWPMTEVQHFLKGDPTLELDSTWWFLEGGNQDPPDEVFMGLDDSEGILVGRARWLPVAHRNPMPYVRPAGVKRFYSHQEATDESRRIFVNRRKSVRQCHFCQGRYFPEYGHILTWSEGQPKSEFVCQNCQVIHLGRIP